MEQVMLFLQVDYFLAIVYIFRHKHHYLITYHFLKRAESHLFHIQLHMVYYMESIRSPNILSLVTIIPKTIKAKPITLFVVIGSPNKNTEIIKTNTNAKLITG